MPRFWTCRKCGSVHERKFKLCQTWRPVYEDGLTKYVRCSGKRPAPRQPKHTKALDLPYEWYVEQFGERCGICGVEPKAGKKLYKDHDHRTEQPRGLLCFRDNKFVPYWVDAEWARKLVAYLDASIGTR